MALNTLKCNHLTPLPFKGLTAAVISRDFTDALFDAYIILTNQPISLRRLYS